MSGVAWASLLFSLIHQYFFRPRMACMYILSASGSAPYYDSSIVSIAIVASHIFQRTCIEDDLVLIDFFLSLFAKPRPDRSGPLGRKSA
jgi:hypothetical protein